MKKSICVYSLLLFFYLFPLTSYADITTGLVGWWKFEEGSGTSAYDSSGLGHTGTLQNTPTWVTGCSRNNCLSFNGANQYITISGIANNGLTTATLSEWVYRSSTSNYVGDVGQSVNSNNRFNMIWYTDGNFYATVGSVFAYTPLVGTGWHLLSYVYNGSLSGNAKMALYIDGVLQTPTFSSSPASTIVATGVFYIGYDPQFSRYDNGEIDDVRIYNRALSAQDVYTLYVGGNRIRSAAIRKYQAKN